MIRENTVKRYLCVMLAIIFIQPQLQAQVKPFKALRYDEDYSYLSKDTSDNWYHRMKYSRLSAAGSSYVSIGGEARIQYFNLKNEDWGDAVRDKDGFVLSRYLFHADLHAGKKFRLFTQLQSSLASGKPSFSPVEQNEMELHQAFADFNSKVGSGNWLLRFGRQEMSYGSQRLISVRELPNNRQSFDGLKTSWKNELYQLDMFYTYYVQAKKGIFNDGVNDDIRLWGAYLTRNKVRALQNIDLYYLGIRKRSALFVDGSATELRHSVGTRIWQNKTNWQYDLEGVYQWGGFGQHTISAWTASANVSHTFPSSKMKPVLGLKAEIISGDRQTGDGRLNTFNPLFPKGAYFGLAALIGPSNLLDIHPYIELAVAKDLSWQTDYDVFWRKSIEDGIYGPNVQIIYPAGVSAKHIGQQLGTALVYTPNQFLNLRGEFTWFNAGGYLKQSGAGKDILMAGATVQFKF
ncbi:alginate export family protein [Terrimonas sp. NA20]|uniref:Alginate export family protein n=1 Tax=Terrimonas ginsenosidimutans TaxID=2908004 RepID=A0ABS9KYM1_9BACT|nr:alginate export family protein [Terrimonas ginsenosidimutans]MCG2617436.1 alginate export family protein [Terrimonas ginsenosidimutans]